jgi:hypothetical protein
MEARLACDAPTFLAWLIDALRLITARSMWR